MLKNLCPTRLEKPLLFKKSFFQPKDILMWGAMRRVVAGHAMCSAVNFRKKHDAKGNDLALHCAP